MKLNKTLYTIILGASLFGMSSCEKFLERMPDNRAEVDSKDKIKKLLTSGYAENAYLMSAEFSSDNVDDYGATNPNSERVLMQLFRWEDVTELGNDMPASVWDANYKAILAANTVLESLEEMGNPGDMSAQRGEALAIRAYGHFVLVNLFAHHYSKSFGATDLGIPYMGSVPKELNPQNERVSVKEVYDNIVKDLEEAVQLVDDTEYGATPKYHFNVAATNAFLARVFLYMGEWQKAVTYADAAIGKDPSGMMRKNRQLATMPITGVTDLAVFYNSSSENANLMLQTAYSNQGLYFGNYYVGSRFSHGGLIASSETFMSDTPWGKYRSSAYVPRVFEYAGTNLDKVLVARVSYMFEFTDPVAQIGYRRAVYSPFTAEEAMLTRAEALIHLNRYDEALADMNRWKNNSMQVTTPNMTVESVNAWATTGPAKDYFTARKPTPKKKFNADFKIDAGTQENMLHAVLLIRRLETMHMGLRWFDVMRYGIEVERRVLSSDGTVATVETATMLKKRDPRRALQIPKDVISAGLKPNPR